MIICVNFHDNPSKNIEAVCITKFSIHLKYFYIAKANNSIMLVANHINSVSYTTTHHNDDLCQVPVQSIMKCRSFHHKVFLYTFNAEGPITLVTKPKYGIW